MSDGARYLIPEDVERNPYPLGRAGVHHDPRNKLHRALVKRPAPATSEFPRRQRGPAFDQDDQPQCVAEMTVGLLVTTPHRAQAKADIPAFDTFAERHQFYLDLQHHDPWPGPPPAYPGSSTDAGVRLLRERGVIGGWSWLFGEDETWEWSRRFGAWGAGTVWLGDMFRPRADGFLDVAGYDAGGHAYEVLYGDPRRQAYRIVNSWGPWGENGRAWVSRTDMRGLLAADGEAVVLG